MKFLEDEWLVKYTESCNEEFYKETSETFTMMEVFLACPDDSVRWLYYEVVNGVLSESSFGNEYLHDDKWSFDFQIIGLYKSYVELVKGNINPKIVNKNGGFIINKSGKDIDYLNYFERFTACKADVDNIEFY